MQLKVIELKSGVDAFISAELGSHLNSSTPAYWGKF